MIYLAAPAVCLATQATAAEFARAPPGTGERIRHEWVKRRARPAPKA
jgi:hypothetical protein